MKREHSQIESTSYSICGLPVCSEVALPVPPLASVTDVVPAWTIRYGDASDRLAKPQWHWPVASGASRTVATSPDDDSTVMFHHYQLGPDGIWFWWDGLATAHVSSDARVVEIYPEPDGDERLLGFILAGPLAAVVLGRLGYPILHASAVATSRGAIAFLGRKGQGKSTMAAAFLRHGEPLLTDDMLLLRTVNGEVLGVPGPAVMKLWRPTIEHTLGLPVNAFANVTSTMEKKLFWIDGHFAMVRWPIRMVTVYLLDRYEKQAGQRFEVNSRALSGSTALRTLLAHVHGPMTSANALGPFLPILAQLVRQARVRVLRCPTGFEWQDSACQLVLDEVNQQ